MNVIPGVYLWCIGANCLKPAAKKLPYRGEIQFAYICPDCLAVFARSFPGAAERAVDIDPKQHFPDGFYDRIIQVKKLPDGYTVKRTVGGKKK